MRISARNQLPGKVRSLVTGPVNAEVVIALPGGGEIVSVITRASAKALGLRKGSDVCAVIKSSDVLVASCSGKVTCDCGKHG